VARRSGRLLHWFALFASPSIRNRAAGGNLVTASPIGDAAPLLLALDAVVHAAATGAARSRRLFHRLPPPLLGPGEIVTAVEIPKPFPHDLRFYRWLRRLDDINGGGDGDRSRDRWPGAAGPVRVWRRSGHARAGAQPKTRPLTV
jgi:xanthine dehydrogenase small subunit